MTPDQGAESGPRDSYSRGFGRVSAVLLLAAVTLITVNRGGKNPTTPSADEAADAASTILGGFREIRSLTLAARLLSDDTGLETVWYRDGDLSAVVVKCAPVCHLRRTRIAVPGGVYAAPSSSCS